MAGQSKPPNHEHLENLMKLITQGDEMALIAFGTLYEQCWKKLAGFAKGELFGQVIYGTERDDIAEETMIKVLALAEKFDPEKGTVLAWMCGIERNLIRTEGRKNRRLQQQDFSSELTDEEDETLASSTLKTQSLVAVQPMSELSICVHQ